MRPQQGKFFSQTFDAVCDQRRFLLLSPETFEKYLINEMSNKFVSTNYRSKLVWSVKVQNLTARKKLKLLKFRLKNIYFHLIIFTFSSIFSIANKKSAIKYRFLNWWKNWSKTNDNPIIAWTFQISLSNCDEAVGPSFISKFTKINIIRKIPIRTVASFPCHLNSNLLLVKDKGKSPKNLERM